MHSRTDIGMTLLGLGGVSTVAFLVLARAVARRDTSYRDGTARGLFPKRRNRRTKRVAAALGPLGKEWVHGPLAIAVAAHAWRHGAGAGALAPPLASLAGTALSRIFERTMPQRSPPPGRHSPTEPSFPSGHSLETMAVALTSAYVLTREELVAARIALPVALVVPVVSGLGRLYLDRHWGSDVLGGWLAGIAVATVCATMYERLAE